MVTTYQQAQGYLDSFINYEKMPSFLCQRALKPERMERLIERLGIEVGRLRVLHIAGTKGKGSTAWLCAWMLASCGHRVGLYISPHLRDFRERIQIVKRSRKTGIIHTAVSKHELVRLTAYFQSRLSKHICIRSLKQVSFFEIYTAIALQYFLHKQVDFAVIETGLGGRFDATNIVTPLVSLITHIGYDHMSILGNKLRDIAAEKAGIIKKNTPLVCAPQRPGALRVIQQHCQRQHAEFFLCGRDFHISHLRLCKERTFFDYAFRRYKLRNIAIALRGSYQAENAACALTALCLLRENRAVDDISSVPRALSSLAIEGRFETISRNPLMVVDIAHNVSSFMVLQDNLRRYYPSKKIIFIFSCAQDKDARKMLKVITSEYLILTRFANPRSYDPRQLQKMTDHREVYVAATPWQALVQALRLYRRNRLIVVSGSFFLVSEVKKILKSAVSQKAKIFNNFYYSKLP